MLRSRFAQILYGDPAAHRSAARTNLVLLIRRTVRPRRYASGLHSLRPCWTAFLSILRWFSRSLLAFRDPFLTVRLVQMIEDFVGFRQHDVSILEDRNIVLA